MESGPSRTAGLDSMYAPKTGVKLAVSNPSEHLVPAEPYPTWRSDRTRIEISEADNALARNPFAIERFEEICSPTIIRSEAYAA